MRIIGESINPLNGQKIYEMGFGTHPEHPITPQSYADLQGAVNETYKQLGISTDDNYVATCREKRGLPSLTVETSLRQHDGVVETYITSRRGNRTFFAQIFHGGRYLPHPAGEIDVYGELGNIERNDVMTDEDIVVLTSHILERQQQGHFKKQRLQHTLMLYRVA